MDLPSFGGSNLEWEALPAHKIDVVVEDAAQVDEVVLVDRFDGVAYLLLEWLEGNGVRRWVWMRVKLLT